MIDLAFEIVLPITFGIIIGYILKNAYSNNCFVLIGFFTGIIVTAFRFYRFMKKHQKQLTENKKRK
ncbi:F0F1-type ATP synthase assembly protein I [Methanococcus maripaludis]|uniref:F0F1-type ATP synthase assembly protein I n=1 Tax=Methanococcus maripaludis TaxID=39152 RepID=A0A7J9S440_METMI|nr:AtpZ/AtpI family protein [Methanococcus maripaludis]MBB6401542.1 F0F1-type ATP synthase assembly protein I [Methanococcus maripaludis]